MVHLLLHDLFLHPMFPDVSAGRHGRICSASIITTAPSPWSGSDHSKRDGSSCAENHARSRSSDGFQTPPWRSPVGDIAGPSDASYEVRILDPDGKEVVREAGKIAAEEFAMPALQAPESPGTHTLEFSLDRRLTRAHPLVVEPQLHHTYEDLKQRWLPAAMPVIEEGINRNPVTTR